MFKLDLIKKGEKEVRVREIELIGTPLGGGTYKSSNGKRFWVYIYAFYTYLFCRGRL